LAWACTKIGRNSHEDKVSILWNQQIKTGRTIPGNKQNFIIHDNEKGTHLLIHIAISGDRNVIKEISRNYRK
jgi:hypothetical protein